MTEEDEEINNYEILFKIIIIGDSGVGKSNILSRYLADEYKEDSKNTVGVELGTKYLKIKGKGAKLQIWDTAGQERYRSITTSYFRGSHGCFIVYDITNEDSFDNIDKWFEQTQKSASKDVSVILVGNKCDLENYRKITKEMGEEKAKTLKCPFFETSAKTNISINDIFEEMTNNIYEKNASKIEEDNIEIVHENENKATNLNQEEEKKESKGCC